ncbi:hypothetical protein F0562_029511 [Nyssa sinensis]|uniref:Uncharacterized protein n=1 Tax=Nyssa sinensis TaxID=561372 RepID=A0A5J5B1C0_9ASTE|nr:hypothetical protein F0562_029511 [Nyssa sinensis]
MADSESFLEGEFFKDQLKIIHEARDAKEDDFEKVQQEEREKVKLSNANPSTKEDHRRKAEEIAKFIQCQDKEMEKFVAEREEQIKNHENRKIAMKRRHWEEEIVDQESLEAVEEIKSPAVFCVAAWFGKFRLIDNMEINSLSPKATDESLERQRKTERARVKKGSSIAVFLFISWRPSYTHTTT